MKSLERSNTGALKTVRLSDVFCFVTLFLVFQQTWWRQCNTEIKDIWRGIVVPLNSTNKKPALHCADNNIKSAAKFSSALWKLNSEHLT
jgi:hypothetical protein